MAAAYDPTTTYLHLEPGGAATPVPVGPDFWATIGNRFDEGYLLTAFRMTDDFPHWEMHPDGDELAIVMTGELELVFDEPGGERRVRVGPHQVGIIPRGVFHYAIVRSPADVVFLTRGKGTQHRPR
jgi:mannose-6-phosphate isomerase-like protein (cupin superfamily)